MIEGLSPHTRGNHCPFVPPIDTLGPIPAYAGEPAYLQDPGDDERAYPRIRGGTASAAFSASRQAGLSPHTRGNQGTACRDIVTVGPIPAYAGEPDPQLRRMPRARAYPRIRGGTWLPKDTQLRRKGLSPHTRGNPGQVTSPPDRSGPIPAYAGEPTNCACCNMDNGAYPRIRGGTVDRDGVISGGVGLSPHTRGNRRRKATKHAYQGPIPAYAGEPTSEVITFKLLGAYPRIRGGTEDFRLMVDRIVGLSPHTRGNRFAMASGSSSTGPIPAYAGEPL